MRALWPRGGATTMYEKEITHVSRPYYHDAMKITPTPHGHRRMHERRVTVADIRNVLNGRPPMHPSPNKRVHTGRALDGRRLEVMYTEAKAGEVRTSWVRIVSVAAS